MELLLWLLMGLFFCCVVIVVDGIVLLLWFLLKVWCCCGCLCGLGVAVIIGSFVVGVAGSLLLCCSFCVAGSLLLCCSFCVAGSLLLCCSFCVAADGVKMPLVFLGVKPRIHCGRTGGRENSWWE